MLTPGWYEVMVGNKRLAYSSSDTYDCSARYPGIDLLAGQNSYSYYSTFITFIENSGIRVFDIAKLEALNWV